MKNLFFVISICLLLSASGCNFLVPAEKYEALQTENNSLTSQIQELQTQIGQLQAQNTALEEKITERREQETVDPFDEKILGSLFLRPDLIPTGGENMRYYTDVCRVLTEQYVYAYAEDGRNAADMILGYERQDENTITWTLAAYNIGDGWQASEGEADPENPIAPPPETPAVSAPSEPDTEDPDSQEPAEPSGTVQDPPAASRPSGLNVPVPNEAQQQKFREIASLI
ncbi:MAG: hypothetical protein HFG19_01985 [Oscillospiraceae bacterium]|nr:hypothetical protein [Oscillospiraceae bacterium]